MTFTVRNPEKYDSSISSNLIDVEHLPEEINYSHCQLLCTEKMKLLLNNKPIRRSIRMALKNNSVVIIEPNVEYKEN